MARFFGILIGGGIQMNGLTPQNFKRIHLGLLLEFILAFVMAGLLVILIAVVNSRISSYDIPAEAVSWTTLEDYAGNFMRLIYAYFILKYAVSAICALVTISGLGKRNPPLRIFTAPSFCSSALYSSMRSLWYFAL